jgi:CDP-diacylglycerol--glycerol-3-phosphate 3-phosphatidyltransferase
VLDLACSLALLMMTLVVATAYVGRVSRKGPARHARIERAGASPLLGKGMMEMGYWAMQPAARILMTLGVSANAVTWTSLALAGAAGLAFATGHLGLAALLSVGSSLCDALDGMIARETGTASDSGEVLDAAVDRYAELFAFGGIAFYERHDAFAMVLTLIATAGAIMVSYATAKAEALHVAAPRGAMRRQERAVYLVLGAALVPFVEAAGAPAGLPSWVARVPLLAVLALIATAGNISAILRLRAVGYAVIREGAARARPTHGSDPLSRDAHAVAGDAFH